MDRIYLAGVLGGGVQWWAVGIQCRIEVPEKWKVSRLLVPLLVSEVGFCPPRSNLVVQYVSNFSAYFSLK